MFLDVFLFYFNFLHSLSSPYSHHKVLVLLIFFAYFSSMFFNSFTNIRQIWNILDISFLSQEKRQPFSPSAVEKLLIIETLTAMNRGM